MIEIKSIKFENPEQIINMGGPWIGDFIYNNIIISKNVIIDNYICNIEQERIFFIQYKKVSNWQKENYFLLNYLDTNTGNIHTFDFKFDRIFIESINSDSLLTYYEAFCEQDEQKQKSINLNELGLIMAPSIDHEKKA